MTKIQAPDTYAQWAQILEMLKQKTDDEAVLDAMMNGKLDWQTGVAERFASKLIDVVNFRLNAAADRFQKELGRAMGQERVIVSALINFRNEMKFMTKTVNLPVIPEKDRKQYYNLVKDYADSTQKSLEDSAKQDRTGKLSSIVRNTKVNSF